MIIYWFLFSVIIILQFIPTTTNRGNKSKLIVSFLLMFIYMAIRGGFANDYEAYEEIFMESHKFKFNEVSGGNIEHGFLILNKILPSYRVLLVLLSAFTCYTYYILFHKYILPKYYSLGFALMAISGGYMLFFQMSGLRNAIAINILALSIPFVKDRKIIPYLGLMALAYFFHNSILLFMPLVYFVSTPRASKSRDIVVWALASLFFIAISTTSLIDNISPLVNLYFDKYAVYTEDAKAFKTGSSLILYLYVVIMIVLTFILSKDILLENDNIILKNSLLFILALLLGSLNFRMSQYFAPYLVVATAVVMSRVKNPVLKYTYLICNVIFLLYSFYIFTEDQYFAFDTYYSIFD
jgi:hypothetical protein